MHRIGFRTAGQILRTSLSSSSSSTTRLTMTRTKPRPTTTTTFVRRFASQRRSFSIRMVYAPYDLLEVIDPKIYEEEILRFSSETTMDDVKNVLRELIVITSEEDFDSLQYMDDDMIWRPFKSVTPLWRRQAVPVRTLSTYDRKLHYPPSFLQIIRGQCWKRPPPFYPMRARNVASCAQDIVIRLRKEGYLYSMLTKEIKLHRTGQVLNVRDYIMKWAERDANLRRLLVLKIGCLKHLITFVHYAPLWDIERIEDWKKRRS